MSSRSRRLREVTHWPSRPANGDVLMVNVIAMVGSSIWIGGSGLGVSALVTVSPMVMPSTPAMARMSPGRADGLVHALQAFERVQLGDLGFVNGAVELADGDFVAVAQRAVEDAADGEAAQIVAVIEIGDQHLQNRRRDRPAGGGMCLDDRVEERAAGRSRSSSSVSLRDAGLRVGVEDREIELVFGRRRDR